MKTTAGLWIDHRKAVIVIALDGEEKKLEILSNVERQPGRFGGIRSKAAYEAQKVKADDSQEQAFKASINGYYEKVIEAIRSAECILIFGPGEAKGEFKKCLTRAKLGRRILALETVDKMTDRQIAARIREHFPQSDSASPKKTS
jgi:stalled ribosome rescue protein Dom34